MSAPGVGLPNPGGWCLPRRGGVSAQKWCTPPRPKGRHPQTQRQTPPCPGPRGTKSPLLGYTAPCPLHAGMHTPCPMIAGTHSPPTPMNRITDRCKNITFPKLRLRAVIKLTLELLHHFQHDEKVAMRLS